MTRLLHLLPLIVACSLSCALPAEPATQPTGDAIALQKHDAAATAARQEYWRTVNHEKPADAGAPPVQGDAHSFAEDHYQKVMLALDGELVDDLAGALDAAKASADVDSTRRIAAELADARGDVERRKLAMHFDALEQAQKPVAKAPQRDRTFVFVCLGSNSMAGELAHLKTELTRAVQGLKPIHSFDIILYQGDSFPDFSGKLVPATPASKRKAEAWLNNITTGGTDDPIPALTLALNMHPQVIYFLADAHPLPNAQAVEDLLKKLNADHKTKVNTMVWVADKDDQDASGAVREVMEKIAADNGGTFKFARTNEPLRPVAP